MRESVILGILGLATLRCHGKAAIPEPRFDTARAAPAHAGAA